MEQEKTKQISENEISSSDPSQPSSNGNFSPKGEENS